VLFKAMKLENSVPNKKTRRFANCAIFLPGRKSIPPLPPIVEETLRHSAIAIWSNAGANHGFGAGENDWLGAEAYVDPPR